VDTELSDSTDTGGLSTIFSERHEDQFNMGVYEEDEVMDMESSRLDEDDDAFNGDEDFAEQLLNMPHGFFANEVAAAVEEEPIPEVIKFPCRWCYKLYTKLGMTRHQKKCKKRPM
jgi:hypothetical protein